MTSSTDPVLKPSALQQSVTLHEVKPGLHIPELVLRSMLPDIETTLFFAKTMGLDYRQLSDLLFLLHRTDVITALFGEANYHSSELQDYIVDTVPPDVIEQHGGGQYDSSQPAPDTELLAQLVEESKVEVAQSIQDIAVKLGSVLSRFPSKFGQMTFKHLHQLNRQRASIGTYDAQIVHQRTAPRLVILDVSGSMTENTVRRIVGEVVGLAYEVDASLATVSDDTFLYQPGTFDVDTVLRDAKYWGTHYETLAPVFRQDWETVITIADYDSSGDAKRAFKQYATGRVGQVLDISLVNRPTFLSKVVGTLATEVKPLMMGRSWNVLSS